MKLHHIHLKNFRCFADFELSFDPSYNLHVLIAENMVGKSALLRAIRIMLSSYVRGFMDSNVFPGITRNDHRIIGTNPLANIARVCSLEVKGHIRSPQGDTQPVAWRRYRNDPLTERTKIENLIGNIGELAAAQYDSVAERQQGMLPLLMYLSPDSFTQARNTRQFDLEGSAFQGYWYCLQAKSVESFALQFLARMYQLSQQQTHSQTAQILYQGLPQAFLDLFQQTLKVLLPGLTAVEWLEDPQHNQATAENEEEAQVDAQSKLTLSLIFNHQEVRLYDMLSDGYRYLTLLAAEMSIRSLLLNRHLGQQVTSHITGVVLIDEFGIHLHPGLQQQALQRLSEAFPHVQFIITTHSPLLINGLDQEQVHIIEAENDGQRTVRHPNQDIIGLGAEGILLEVFGLDSTFDHQTRERLRRYQELTRKRLAEAITDQERDELGQLIEQLSGLTYDGAAQDPLYRKLLKRLAEHQVDFADEQLSESMLADQVITDLINQWNQS